MLGKILFIILFVSSVRAMSVPTQLLEVPKQWEGLKNQLIALKVSLFSLPEQVFAYWNRLLEMEMDCTFRMACDLAVYLSPRIPYWLNQMLGVYFTSHSADNIYFRAVANGMINHNCNNYYPKCSLNTFFANMATNVSDIISTTISPLDLRLMNAINTISVNST